ncbi:MAG: tetratricopeptide repeat protein [Armatimonadetes bacterium]|nr:tetratricopeptide repeat protein [Armatimonadota bacterium]MDW8122231.1 tetratricopeptide repeat protein [Armatimonadota bacterium]
MPARLRSLPTGTVAATLAVALLVLSTVLSEAPPSAQRALFLLILPPAQPPAEPKIQEKFLSTFRFFLSRAKLGWSVGNFDPESPSLLRAIAEGKLSPEVKTRPSAFAETIAQAEGAGAVVWISVLDGQDGEPLTVLVHLVWPKEDKFVADLKTFPPKPEEMDEIKKVGLSEKFQKDPSLLLALRVVGWLKEALLKREEPVGPPPDLGEVDRLAAEGKWDDAIRRLSEMVAANPAEPSLYQRLGALYEAQNKWEEASLEYRRAVQLKGDLWEAWKGSARVEAKRKRYDRVLEAVRRLTEGGMAGEAEKALGAEAAFQLATEAFRRGRDREASALFKQAEEWDRQLVLEAKEPQIIKEAVQRLASRKRYDEVVGGVKKLYEEKSADPQLLELGVEGACRIKQYEIAYRFLSAILEQQKDFTPASPRVTFFFQALDQEAVRFFELMRKGLGEFNDQKILKQDLMNLLVQLEEGSAKLLKNAYGLKVPTAYDRSHRRRILSLELFQQAVHLLKTWLTEPDELTYRRAMILLEFSRLELEAAQPSSLRPLQRS